jgi:hypothetical protein
MPKENDVKKSKRLGSVTKGSVRRIRGGAAGWIWTDAFEESVHHKRNSYE